VGGRVRMRLCGWVGACGWMWTPVSAARLLLYLPPRQQQGPLLCCVIPCAAVSIASLAESRASRPLTWNPWAPLPQTICPAGSCARTSRSYLSFRSRMAWKYACSSGSEEHAHVPCLFNSCAQNESESRLSM